MERNPEFAQIMNNPQLLRESMQLASNPVSVPSTIWISTVQSGRSALRPFAEHRQCAVQALMREQMRNTDRAFSNLESHPEGFNALRRMYEDIQVLFCPTFPDPSSQCIPSETRP